MIVNPELSIKIYFLLIISAFLGCDAPSSSVSPNSGREGVVNVMPEPAPEELVPIPDDVSYTFEKDESLRDVKRSVVTLLNKRVSSEVLRSLAFKIKRFDPVDYERTFMMYYVPGIDPLRGNGTWATTHFNPDIDVRILGLTQEQIETLQNKPFLESRRMIGSWIIEIMGLSHRLDLFEEDGKVWKEKTYGDESSGIVEMVELVSNDGRRFEEIEPRFGEYLWVHSTGELQFWDEEGRIDVFLRDPEKLEIPENLRALTKPESVTETPPETALLSEKDKVRLSGYLSKAKRFIDQELNEGAKQYLEAVIAQAPESEYAVKARKLLEGIE